MPELSKNYAPNEVEERWYQRWLDDKSFVADPARVSEKRPAYSIVIPPPNVTGILTLGHVLNNTIQDILCRRARMLGKEVLWLPGTDHAGIATQNVVEKTLKKQGVIKHRDDLGRDKLVEKIWEWKEKHGGIIIQQLKKLGASCDWSRERFTMDEDYSRCVQKVFVDLYKKGLIYRGKRMVNWCPSSLTALSDEEVTMKTQKGMMYYFQVEVIGDDTPHVVRPRAVDITAEQEETAKHEHTRPDPRTGLSSYITGPRFDERAGAALSAANRRRVGAAASCMDESERSGAGEEIHEGREQGLRAVFALSSGIAVISLESLGIRRAENGQLTPADASMLAFKPGSEAQPFADVARGVVYKVFAADEDGNIGRKTRITLTQGQRPHVDFEGAEAIETLDKLALLHEIGGVPTEIIGVTPNGDWIVAQPLCTPVSVDEFAAARAEAVAHAGGVQVNDYGLDGIRIVWHRGQVWVITDLHVKNIMRDSEGKARIMDALILPMPKALRELPSVRQAIAEAKAKAGITSNATHAQEEFSVFEPAKQKTFLTIATTRPEVIPGDQAIAVNPKDPRYFHLIGKHVRRPLPLEHQELIPIIGDDHVDFEFGTGVLKVTPAHDKADFEIAQRHGLPAVDVLHPNGVLNELAGKDLAGLDRFEGRKKAAELLKEIGSLVKEEPYQNNVGYSERADVPIEPRLSEQWFLKYPSVKESQDVVANGEMRFFPDRWAKVYDHWMGGLQDWCISRQLWWGHRVPVWKKIVSLSDTGRSLEDQLPKGFLKSSGSAKTIKQNAVGLPDLELECALDDGQGKSSQPGSLPSLLRLHQREVDDEASTPSHLYDIHVCTVDDAETAELQRNGFTQDSDVLDTWFSSWLWPFATMGWTGPVEGGPKSPSFQSSITPSLHAFYPTTDLVTGPDIIFFWVARMIMAGYEWMGEMPFKNVYFTGIIRDKQGRKMSKSLGNSPDPLDLIEKFGADALRFGIMRSAPLGADILFDEKNVELGRNFCTKLWNATRFRQMQSASPRSEGVSPSAVYDDEERAGRPSYETEAEINPALLTSDDKWILLRLNTAISEVTTALEEYRFSDAAQTLYRFFWSEYCDWYLETCKATLQGDDATRKANTLAVMDYVLGHTLRIFHPFMPFITEDLWHGMGFNQDMPENQGGKSIMFAPWPKPLDEDEMAHFGLMPEDEKTANDKYELVNLGRGLRSSFNLPSSKRLRFVFRPASPLPPHDIEVIKILLNADVLEIVDSSYAPTKGTPTTLTPLGELFLPLEGLIDVEAERGRTTKEITKVTQELEKVRAKLADPTFTGKVPAAVLEDHRTREAGWSAQLVKLEEMLKTLG